MKYRLIASAIILVIIVLVLVLKGGTNSATTDSQDGSVPASTEQPSQ
jgi:hypothetical protein